MTTPHGGLICSIWLERKKEERTLDCKQVFRGETMTEVKINATKDWLETAAEIEAQGVRLDWRGPGAPSPRRPLEITRYDPINKKWCVRQAD